MCAEAPAASPSKLGERQHAAGSRPTSPRIAARFCTTPSEAGAPRAQSQPRGAPDEAELGTGVAALAAKTLKLMAENARLAAENRRLAAASHTAYQLTQRVESLREQTAHASASLAQVERKQRGRSRSVAASHRFCVPGSGPSLSRAATAVPPETGASAAASGSACTASAAEPASAAAAGGSGMMAVPALDPGSAMAPGRSSTAAASLEPPVYEAEDASDPAMSARKQRFGAASDSAVHHLDSGGTLSSARPEGANAAGSDNAAAGAATAAGPGMEVLMLRAELREKDDLLRVTRRQLEVRTDCQTRLGVTSQPVRRLEQTIRTVADHLQA